MAKAAPVSPFAPKLLPEVPAIDGVRLATAEAGIRYKGRTDLLLAVLDPGTTAAGVLTQSKTRSAPVEWCAQSLLDGRASALVFDKSGAAHITVRVTDFARREGELVDHAGAVEPVAVAVRSPLEPGRPHAQQSAG